MHIVKHGKREFLLFFTELATAQSWVWFDTYEKLRVLVFVWVLNSNNLLIKLTLIGAKCLRGAVA